MILRADEFYVEIILEVSLLNVCCVSEFVNKFRRKIQTARVALRLRIAFPYLLQSICNVVEEKLKRPTQ
jgi:hypothetical protein